MIIDMVNKLVDDTLKEDTGMAKKNKDRFTQMDITKDDINQGEADAQMIQDLEMSKEEVAVGLDMEKWEEPRKVESNVLSLADKYKLEDEEILAQKLKEADELRKTESEVKDLSGESGTEEEKRKREDELLKKEIRKRNLKLRKEDIESGFTFTDVTRVSRGNDSYKYQTLASAATLGRLWDEQILEYRGQIQRGYKLNSKNEEVAVFSASHVKKILESALTQKLNGGVITLNILDTIPINFDEDDKTIQLLPEQKLQILDGQHRIRCFSAWNRLFLKSPSSCISPEEFFMPILIEHVSENNAKLIFSEYATKFLKISNSRSLFLDVDSNINKIARKVMSKTLNNKVEVVSNTIKKNSDKIISFSVLTKGISAFKPATPKECEKVGNFLCLFWEELIENFPKSMGDVHPEVRAFEKSKSFANESMFMIGYHHVAKLLIDDEDWKIKLKKLTMGGFMNRTNPIWKDILRNENRIVNTSSTQTTVINNMLNQVVN